MRISRLAFCLLGLACGSLAGCSQTWGIRSRSPSKTQTVASVGDKPLPIALGEPDSSRGETEELDPPPSTGSRISGRVFDGRGQAVPNAKVRLVVDGAPGGRAKYATTDRSGAFTLHGLRPGSTYTLVAESQNEDGMMSGRAQARAPQTGVHIGLVARGSEFDPRRVPIRPARARVEPGSEDDGDGDDRERLPEVGNSGGAVDGDREPPAEEAAALSPRKGSRSSARMASTASSAPIRAGWNARQRPSTHGARPPVRSRVPADSGDSRRRSPTWDASGREYDDDGENPLPPALEREESDSPPPRGGAAAPALSRAGGEPAASRVRRRGQETTPVALDPAEPVTDRGGHGSPDPDESEPRFIPEEILPPARGMRTASDASRAASPEGALTARPGRRGRRGSPPAATRSARSSALADPPEPADSTEGEPSDPSPPRRPTWRELSLSPNAVPLDESLRRSSVDVPTGTRHAATRASTAAEADSTRAAQPGRLRLFSRPQPAAAPAPGAGQRVCHYDPNDHRIVDFQLPGLDGTMISFHDFDADVILLDFWGSWCRECRKSISHLGELQAKLGGKRLQVVGIACEKGATFEERRASAAAAIQRLEIPYPVLVSTLDGTCPLQQALNVQFYPTLILVDRAGRIVHLEQGATAATLGRTDRSIATALRAAGTPLE